MEQPELAKGGRKGLCLGDVRELAVPRGDQAKPAPPLQGYPRGSPASGGGLGCLTARVPASLSFSESHVMTGKAFSLRKAAGKPRATPMLRDGRRDMCRCAHSPSQTRMILRAVAGLQGARETRTLGQDEDQGTKLASLRETGLPVN